MAEQMPPEQAERNMRMALASALNRDREWLNLEAETVQVLMAEYDRMRAEAVTELAVFWGGGDPNNHGSTARDGKCILRPVDGLDEFRDMNVEPPGGRPWRLARREVHRTPWVEVREDERIKEPTE